LVNEITKDGKLVPNYMVLRIIYAERIATHEGTSRFKRLNTFVADFAETAH